MSTGFGAVPEESRQIANAITDAVGAAEGLSWDGPGGDYGHAGVRQGWSGFLADMRDRVSKLQTTADTQAENLKQAANSYVEADDSGGSSLSGIGDAVGETGMVGGGWTGGRTGFMSPKRSAELFPRRDIGSALDPDDGRDY